MSKTLILEDNIEGTKYHQLLDICFNLSTYFSFTKRHFHTKNSVYLKFLKDLAPSYIKTEFTWHWFSYYLYSKEPLEVCLYHADSKRKDVIKKYFNNLFQEDESMNGKSRNIKNLPEDLCFFKDNQLLLGTVSHAWICFAYPPTDIIADQFKPLGKWKEGDFSEEQIFLNFNE